MFYIHLSAISIEHIENNEKTQKVWGFIFLLMFIDFTRKIIWTADDVTTDGEDVAGLHPLTGELLGGTWRTVAVAVSIF